MSLETNETTLNQPLLLPPPRTASDTSSTSETSKINIYKSRPSDSDEIVSKGEVQEKSFRDFFFIFLFVLHVFIIVILGLSLGAPALARRRNTDEDNGDDDLNYEYEGLLKLVLSCTCLSCIFSITCLCIMICSPIRIIQFSLWGTILGTFTLAILAFAYEWIFSGMCFLLICIPSMMYSYFIWNGVRMKFAACNLEVGLQGVKSNIGVLFFSFGMVVLCMVYTLFWILALIGVYDKSADCDAGDCVQRPDVLGILFVFLGYFWTGQVLQNAVGVVVSASLGKWWCGTTDNESCSAPVQGSIVHVAYSFGSICFGSLLSFLTGILHQLVEVSQPLTNEDANCLVRCTCNSFHSIVEYVYTYFNKWSYVYVGLYGYGYMEASQKSLALLHNRGWETIIADDLLPNSLSLVVILNASLCSLLGLALTEKDDWFYNTENVKYTGMILAFCIGLVLSSILVSIVETSVNTVIVLFAESPGEFQSTHPDLSGGMIETWSLAYPDL